MLKQKFNDIFRRKQKERSDQPRRQQQIYFNEGYFQIKLVYNPHKLSLIKVISNIIVGPDAGTPMMVNCKWLIKKNNHYSEIQGVTSSCYQPCIEDVGCSILVQITPLIEGKTYSGATIVKETGPLQLGSALETQFMDIKTKMYHNNEPVEFLMKIQAVFGKQSSYSNLEYPQDGKLIIRKQEDSNFEIQISTTEFHTYFWITQQFPTAEFIRKSYNSIVISFTEFESMRLAFKQNIDREILGLLLRTLTANSTIQGPTKDLEIQEVAQQQPQQQQIQEKQVGSSPQSPHHISQQKNSIKMSAKMESLESIQKQAQKSQGQLSASQKNEQSKSEGMIGQNIINPMKTPAKLKKSTTNTQQQIIVHSAPPKNDGQSSIQLEMKVGELNMQINKIRKEYKDLMKNYNLQKQNKSKLQNQLKKSIEQVKQFEGIKKQKQQLTKLNQKMKQDNRFYKNEVTLLNKNLKKKQAQVQTITAQKQALQKKLQKYESSQGKNRNKNIDNNIQDLLKNQSQNWRKYNNELVQQNQDLKSQIQKLQNSLKTANKKLESLSQQKMIKQQYPKSLPLIPAQSTQSQMATKDKIIGNLQFKITNLQLLLKHKGGEHGNEGMTFQKIINSLTQDITQKQIQLQQLKKVNKDLLQRIKNPSSIDSI